MSDSLGSSFSELSSATILESATEGEERARGTGRAPSPSLATEITRHFEGLHYTDVVIERCESPPARIRIMSCPKAPLRPNRLAVRKAQGPYSRMASKGDTLMRFFRCSQPR